MLLVAANAGAADRDEWHMEYKFKQRISICEMLNRYSPTEDVKEYFAYVAVPPELDQQRQTHTSFAVNGRFLSFPTTTEQSSYHRPIFMARLPSLTPPDHTNITVTAVYETTLYSRQLIPGSGTNLVSALSPVERNLDLKDSWLLDFKSPGFAAWLRENNLQLQPDESLIAFGRRVGEFVHAHMTYSFPSPTEGKPLSDLCRVLNGHCGQYALLFAGIMRANGIPTRSLAGTWIVTGQGPRHSDAHVKSEFFVEGIGWVPVDSNHGDFGREDGDFFACHLYVEEPMELPSPWGGIWRQFYLQEIYLPCDGGSWDKPTWTHLWTETPLQMPSPPAQKTERTEAQPSAAERLKELKDLYDQGLISKEIYDQKRQQILNSL